MEQRSLNEALIDRLLLLYLVTRTRQKGYNILGPIKLQKLLYKIEERMWRKNYKGLSYTFIRWKHGPFSQEIYSDVRDLKDTGLLNKVDAVSSSSKGQHLIEKLEPLFDYEAKDIIEKVINEFGSLKSKQIKAIMYSYPKVGERRTIGEIKDGDLLLTKMKASDARKSFWLDERLMETLCVLFSPSATKAIQDGLDAIKKEEGRPFIPVH